jgi:putative hydrolase of the HAD superfamily
MGARDGAVAPRAVIFDLFGTLVPEYTKAEFSATIDAIADAVNADRVAFREAWSDSAAARQTGGYATIEDNVRDLCRSLGLSPDERSIAIGLEPRAAMYARRFHPRDGAVETLATLRGRGYPIAMISMCAPDTPALWRATEMAPLVDVTVFSCEVGLRKPEPEIYLLATDGLGVEPSHCVYVGDGAYGELTGAAALGMRPYLVLDPAIDDPDAMLTPERDGWEGPTIAALDELLAFLPGSGVSDQAAAGRRA